jgi:hypothetical protein
MNIFLNQRAWFFFLRLSVEMTNKSKMKESTSFSINFRSAPYATGATVMTSALPTSPIAGVLNGSGNALYWNMKNMNFNLVLSDG